VQAILNKPVAELQQVFDSIQKVHSAHRMHPHRATLPNLTSTYHAPHNPRPQHSTHTYIHFMYVWLVYI
jgi:hypothetical protein